MSMNSLLFILGVSILQIQCSPHHGGLHAEHRMLNYDEPSQAASTWPDSHSHWADIPTSQSFHTQVLQKWQPSSGLPGQQIEDTFPSKRHAAPTADHFASDHAEFDSSSSIFGGGLNFPGSLTRSPSHVSSLPSPPRSSSGIANNGFNYNVQYEDSFRPKRQQQESAFVGFAPQGPPPVSTSSASSFASPFHANSEFKPQGRQPLRPLRHVTSFPAAFHPNQPHPQPQPQPQDFQDKEDRPTRNYDDFEFNPFQGSGGKSHSYTTFEAPKVNSNVFIDHNSEAIEVKRPSRSPLNTPLGPPRTNNHFRAPSFRQQKRPGITQHQEQAEQEEAAPPSYDDYLSEAEEPNYKNQGNFAPDYSNNYEEDYNDSAGLVTSPFQEYQDQGRHSDENYDRVNKEERGNYEIRDYRQPPKVMKYERDEPVEVTHYGNDFGGVETFQGGYDSEDDAKRGINRFQRKDFQSKPNEDMHHRPEFYMDDEPVEDYTQEGYYVPQERQGQRPEELEHERPRSARPSNRFHEDDGKRQASTRWAEMA